jgi:hypothetical protein
MSEKQKDTAAACEAGSQSGASRLKPPALAVGSDRPSHEQAQVKGFEATIRAFNSAADWLAGEAVAAKIGNKIELSIPKICAAEYLGKWRASFDQEPGKIVLHVPASSLNRGRIEFIGHQSIIRQICTEFMCRFRASLKTGPREFSPLAQANHSKTVAMAKRGRRKLKARRG